MEVHFKDLAIILLLFGVLNGIPTFANHVNPGFEARITKKGLSYANTAAINALSEKVKGLKIPNQSGSTHGVDYSVSDMVIDSFNKPSSNINIVPNIGLKWSANGLGLSMHGNWRYKYKKGWFKISDHGRFSGSISGLSFSLTMNIGKDSQGRPDISAKGCSCDIGSVHIKFHGGKAFIYNLFSGLIEKQIKKLLKSQMCDIVIDAVNTDGEKELKKLPVEVEILKKFILDYSLMSTPTFNSQYMQTYHKGEIMWKGDQSNCPFEPSTIPINIDNSKMVYLWLTDYIANSMGYTAYKHNYLKYNLTTKDLPAGNRSVLNTTCTGLLCVGKLIPQIGEKYPNRVVKINMVGSSAPRMVITNNNIHVNATGILDLYAQKPSTPDIFLLRLNMFLGIDLNVTLKNELLYASVSHPKLKIKVLKSEVGKVSGTVIETLTQLGLNLAVIPMLNSLGAKGLSLPVVKEIKFTQSSLILQKNSLMIATDVVYRGTSFDVNYQHVDVNKHTDVNNKQPVFHVVGDAAYQNQQLYSHRQNYPPFNINNLKTAFIKKFNKKLSSI